MKTKICKSKIIISFFAVMTAALLFLCLAGCSQNSQQDKSKNDPAIGQWETMWKSTNQPNKEEPCILTLNADGKAYWMSLANSSGYQITDMCYETWEKLEDDIYSITEDTGENYKFRYDKDADTFNSLSYGLTYSRLDPIVGIWTGASSDGTGNGNATTVFKSDGTSVFTISFENGKVDVYNLTWKKTSNNDYDIYYGTKKIRTYTVSEDGKNLSTDDNRTKTKCFTDSTYLVPEIGVWYCPENYSIVFNADGTGYKNYNNKEVCSFTWHDTKGGVEATYKNGTDFSGNSLAGKTYTWTYNMNDNTLSSSIGTKSIRPTSSVDGLITFK